MLQRRAYEAMGIRVKMYLLEDKFHLRICKRKESERSHSNTGCLKNQYFYIVIVTNVN